MTSDETCFLSASAAVDAAGAVADVMGVFCSGATSSADLTVVDAPTEPGAFGGRVALGPSSGRAGGAVGRISTCWPLAVRIRVGCVMLLPGGGDASITLDDVPPGVLLCTTINANHE